MNEFKHTPAPWNIVGKIDAGRFDIKKDDKRIAQYRCFYADGDIDEIKANATLMAESPNLLKCLIDMVEVNDEPCRFDHKGFCQAHYLDHESEGCRVANAKAAIAKIRGNLDE